MITGESLRSRKSLMRMRIDRSIVYPWTSDTGTQRTSLVLQVLRIIRAVRLLGSDVIARAKRTP